MAKTRTYQHFCPVARSLEVIGEKWSLLIVRDLLRGPARFTDLSRTLGNITPKWLTQRLRDMEAAGLVERDSVEGKREVYYRLTARGRELAPVVGALNAWGMRNALREPQPEETLTAGVFAPMLAGFFANRRLHLSRPRTWLLSFGPEQTYAVRFDGRHWAWEKGPAGGAADVRIAATTAAWASFLAAKGAARREKLGAMAVEGEAEAVEEMLAAFAQHMG